MSAAKSTGFRKSSKKTSRRSTRDHVDDESGDVEETALHSIKSIQKKRKLVQSTLYKKGLGVQHDSATTTGGFRGNPTNNSNSGAIRARARDEHETEEASSNRHRPTSRTDLLKNSFSNSGGAQAESVMSNKHKAAMEQFISSKLQNKSNVGKSVAFPEVDIDVERDGLKVSKDEDVGSGGAMLGGTGIAEVVLGLQSRLETARKTEELREARSSKLKALGPAQEDESLPASYRHFLSEGRTSTSTYMHTSAPSNARGVVREESTSCDPSLEANGNRKGFQVLRHGANSEKESKILNRNQRASDESVLKKFIKREMGR